jgi:uncharacterized membrane protein
MADGASESGAGGQDRKPGRSGYLGRLGVIARAGHLEYDRILFFTDAVFAIAITLLIVDLPAHIRHDPRNGHLIINWDGIIGFAISFAVIGLFWMAHHSLFRFISAFDGTLMRLNLLFIGTIAFLPYPTALLSTASSTQKSTVVFYAACAGSAGLVEATAWTWARKAGLVAGLGPQEQRLLLLRAWLTPAVFAGSILIALRAPRAAMYFWLAILVGSWIINRVYGHHDPDQRADSPDAAPGDPPDAPPQPG